MPPLKVPADVAPPVDPIVLAGLALAAGGLAVVSPWQVVVAAVAIVALAMRMGRASIAAPAVVAVALAVGFARAGAAVRRHEAERV
ncbi:MAG TPA: hypothetical protein VII82_03450, partial [Polyangiaceae bacterium]